MTLSDRCQLDRAIETSHLALDAFVKGDPRPLKAIYSTRDEVSLANPFGPPVLGLRQVAETMDRAAAYYRDGRATGFERIAEYLTAELACIVEVERYESKVGGGDEIVPISLRVTTVFRPEDGAWKIVHRHADPITAGRPAESVVSAIT